MVSGTSVVSLGDKRGWAATSTSGGTPKGTTGERDGKVSGRTSYFTNQEKPSAERTAPTPIAGAAEVHR
jgi:hypothetical protein